MGSKYVDVSSIMQVIGCVYNNPSLLDMTDKYSITDDDFTEDFHKIVFGAMYKIHELGAKTITLENILDYLTSRPKSLAVYQQNKGDEYLCKVSEVASQLSFDYYYNRMKKMTLLRAYDNIGLDVSFIYDPDNILDSAKKQKQEDYLDNSSLAEIADRIDSKIEDIRMTYVDGDIDESVQAADGIDELIDELKEHPEVGIPMYGPLINSITRGARLRKLYLRSAPTGIGKSRTLIADACNFSCGKIYDENFGWIKSGSSQPTLFIATEQDKSEIQTMMLAFLSNVNEEHILNGWYEEGEEDRVRQAAQILKEAPLYIEELPDFSLQDVENVIKRNIRDHDVLYICYNKNMAV